MSDQIEYLSFDEALTIVGAIQEEEDIRRKNHRVLTVYSKDDREICWFDFDEVMETVGQVEAGEKKATVEKYILNHIPRWALDM
jgi:hypothetical protein